MLLRGSWLGSVCRHDRGRRQHCWSAMGSARLLHCRPERWRWGQLQTAEALEVMVHGVIRSCLERDGRARLHPAPWKRLVLGHSKRTPFIAALVGKESTCVRS